MDSSQVEPDMAEAIDVTTEQSTASKINQLTQLNTMKAVQVRQKSIFGSDISQQMPISDCSSQFHRDFMPQDGMTKKASQASKTEKMIKKFGSSFKMSK